MSEIVNGRECCDGWRAKLEESQSLTEIIQGFRCYKRIRFGDEEQDWGANRGLCHDCAARKGQFHVYGCDVERCPMCKGQLISCSCEYDGIGTKETLQ